jgi:hypothetical protein
VIKVKSEGSSCPSVLHFVPPFGPETSGSKEDSVSREDLRIEGKRFALKDTLDQRIFIIILAKL